MNLLLILLLPVITVAASIKPTDDLVNNITNFQEEISTKQSDYLSTILGLRQTASSVQFSFQNGYVDLIKKILTQIEALDKPAREIFAAEVQSPCIANLNNFLDNIQELSMFAVSICVEDILGWKQEIKGITNTLDSLTFELSNLNQAILDGMIGKNSYTEPEAIIQRQSELIAQKIPFFEKQLNPIDENLKAKTIEVLNFAYPNEQPCFDAIITSINSAIAAVTSQLSICKLFSGRGSRFAVSFNANQFFPDVVSKKN